MSATRPCQARDINAGICSDTTSTAPSTALSKKAGQLSELLDSKQLSLIHLKSAQRASVTTLVHASLRQLDPDNRLPADALRTLDARVTADITPIVAQAFRSIEVSRLSTLLSACYATQLTPSDLDALLAYYRSPQGQRYRIFSTELEAIVTNSIVKLSAGPFSFNRTQQADSARQAKRRALIAMSPLARQLQADHPADPHRGSVAGFALATEFLAMQSAEALDQLAQRNQSDLPAFATFQRSPAALNEVRTEQQWAAQSEGLFAPALKQAEQALAAHQPGWHDLARQLQSRQASAAQ